MTVRIHAALAPTVENDARRKAEFLDMIVKRFDLKNLNESRFINLGILSADVDVVLLEEMRRTEGLTSVTIDEALYASVT